MENYDVIVLGAGFAGLRMVHRLTQDGLRVKGLEKAPEVGGTWYWNTYPGARCDVESVDYSYSFEPQLEQEWTWKERYATQPEILAYASFVADKLDVRRHFSFSTTVTAANWNEESGQWVISTDSGSTYSARFFIPAVGALSASNVPSFPGMHTFKGRTFHTGQWPREKVDFEGRRVAVLGTGSSGIQVVPLVAEQAADLYVLQRTPNYTMPANNRPLSPEETDRIKSEYAARRAKTAKQAGGLPYDTHPEPLASLPAAEAERILAEYWEQGGLAYGISFPDIRTNEQSNLVAAQYAAKRIKAIVKDPLLAEKLIPKSYPLGAKRLCTDSGYYAAFNRENVHLVDLLENPLAEITPEGFRLQDGTTVQVDDIIFATGFDALTGPLLQLGITGRNGAALAEAWEAGPMTYLGLSVHGFPNMFLLAGPGAPTPLTNAIRTIEPQADWIANAIATLTTRPDEVFEADKERQEEWVQHCNQLVEGTLFLKANSWYLGANIPGKPRMFMAYVGGLPKYRELLQEAAEEGYPGFISNRVATHV